MKERGLETVTAETTPEPLVYSIELLMPARVSAPVDEKDEVAVAPKYAPLYAEKAVVEAPPLNC